MWAGPDKDRFDEPYFDRIEVIVDALARHRIPVHLVSH
jgi:hypothetical protein